VAGLTLDAGALSAYERGGERVARAAGSTRRATPGAATIDACIAVGVRRRGDAIVTSDPDDMRALLGPDFTILAV